MVPEPLHPSLQRDLYWRARTAMEAEALGLDVLRALRIFDYWIRQSDFATSPEDLFREVFYELHAQVPDVEDFGQMMKEWL